MLDEQSGPLAQVKVYGLQGMSKQKDAAETGKKEEARKEHARKVAFPFFPFPSCFPPPFSFSPLVSFSHFT